MYGTGGGTLATRAETRSLLGEHRPHNGVVLLRLEDERVVNKIAALQRLLEGFAEQLANQFVVVTERQIRFARTSE